MKGNPLPYYLVITALFLGVASPGLLSQGMFFDGVTYAAVSRNLALGMGSFWDLHYTHTLYPHFHEHPPLAFALQGLFFRVLGGSILVEKLYSLSSFVLTGLITIRIWKRVTDTSYGQLAWLPLLFWILIPLVTWAAHSNILENTLMVFTGLSVLFILRSLDSNHLLNLTIAGLMLFLGCLTKGFVALFPLALPFWICLFMPGWNYRKFITDSLVLVLATLLPFMIMFMLIPESKESLMAYVNKQVVGSLRDVQTVQSRFYILWRLFLELLPGLVLVMVIFLSSRKYRTGGKPDRWFHVFIALGLTGVVPIMISMKQRGFYMLAAFPLFSLALSTLVVPRVYRLVQRVNVRSKAFVFFRYLSITLLAFSLFLVSIQHNRIGRDREMIEDIQVLMNIIPWGSTVAVPSELWGNWSLHAYLQRYAGISLESIPSMSKFLLVQKGNGYEGKDGYARHDVSLHLYDLYTR